MTLVSTDRDVHLFDDIALVAAAVPLGSRLGFAFSVGSFAQEAIVAGGGLPRVTPAAPGILAEVGIEPGVGPGLPGVYGDFDFFDSIAGIEGDALDFDFFSGVQSLL